MIVSEARVAANRRNALKSTGPKTPEGKEKSRANGLKHGLCSSVVVPEDAAAVQERAMAYWRTLRPQNEFHSWLVDQVAVLTLRVDRCERIERRLRDKVSLRAELTWEEDRRLEIEHLGGQIARRPAEVVEALKKTPQGCEWLMGRWALLAHAAKQQGSWTPDQTQIAFDLLGTPAAFREGARPGASIDLEGNIAEPAEDLPALARREIAELQARRDLASEMDEVERSLAGADLSDGSDIDLRRLRRYEGSLHSRLRWCMAMLQFQSPHKTPHPDLKPRWARPAEPAAEEKSAPPPSKKSPEFWEAPAPNPPIDLTIKEQPAPGDLVDLPKVMADRRHERLKKAETRRQSRRRKLERLRA